LKKSNYVIETNILYTHSQTTLHTHTTTHTPYRGTDSESDEIEIDDESDIELGAVSEIETDEERDLPPVHLMKKNTKYGQFTYFVLYGLFYSVFYFVFLHLFYAVVNYHYSLFFHFISYL
jgi:hypothetical protein